MEFAGWTERRHVYLGAEFRLDKAAAIMTLHGDEESVH